MVRDTHTNNRGASHLALHADEKKTGVVVVQLVSVDLVVILYIYIIISASRPGQDSYSCLCYLRWVILLSICFFESLKVILLV